MLLKYTKIFFALRIKSDANFVRLNMKVRKYKRKGMNFTGEKYRRQQWKLRNKFRSGGGKDKGKCFKCGGQGHWAKNCKGSGTRPWSGEDTKPKKKIESTSDLKEGEIETVSNDQFAKMSDLLKFRDNGIEFTSNLSPNKSVEPIRNSCGGEVENADAEVMKVLRMFGHKSWRYGQEEAIMRILSGISTLICLPTGTGKSLCYQLPAYMYAKKKRCIAIVVSPLVSLMDDQVSRMKIVKGACLHTGMTPNERDRVLNKLENLHLLLLSPEALTTSSILPSQLPPISFACIDEAHCLHDWSQNFRPSYLKVCSVLRHKFGVRCLVGLTATAAPAAIHSIQNQLRIKSHDVLTSVTIPENLVLSVSRDSEKDKALLKLLSGDRFNNSSSLIIYCNRRQETDRVASLIRTSLTNFTAESYHAGLTHTERKRVQKKFMSGKLRAVVATVAFGMGLDKSDVRTVIHYNMPKSVESYVQEIGRAGRDGQEANCHVFLDLKEEEINEHRRHIHSVTVDRITIKKLLRKIFKSCSCEEVCVGHEVLFPIEAAVFELDVKEEVISTILCYLELDGYAEFKLPCHSVSSIKCYGGPKQLLECSSCPPVGITIADMIKNGINLSAASQVEIDIEKTSNVLRWPCSTIVEQLRSLEWKNGRKTGVIVRFSDPCFCVLSKRVSHEQVDKIIDSLTERVMSQQNLGLKQLKKFHSILKDSSYPSLWSCCDSMDIEKSKELKDSMIEFLKHSLDLIHSETEEHNQDDESLDRHIAEFIQLYSSDHQLNGRAIARIFHGIDSPRFPARTWGSVRKFWRSRLQTDFEIIRKRSIEFIIKLSKF